MSSPDEPPPVSVDHFLAEAPHGRDGGARSDFDHHRARDFAQPSLLLTPLRPGRSFDPLAVSEHQDVGSGQGVCRPVLEDANLKSSRTSGGGQAERVGIHGQHAMRNAAFDHGGRRGAGAGIGRTGRHQQWPEVLRRRMRTPGTRVNAVSMP